MFLGLWGRFLVLIIGGLVIVVAIFIAACFIGPGCWGFEYLQNEKQKKRKRKMFNTFNNPNSKTDSYRWLDNKDFVFCESGSLGFEAKVKKVIESPLCHPKEKVFNIKCAPLLVAPNFYPSLKRKTPKLEVKLCCSDLDPGGVISQLTVKIISVTSLFNREYMASLDPFVVLEIINNKWFLQKRERIVYIDQTATFKHCLNPNFNQKFVFDMKKIELKNCCLKFTIFDNDRYTKVIPLFERRLYLKDIKNLITEEYLSFNLSMHEVTENVGELLFGISYLPTAQRLTIGIIKAANLKYQNCVHSLAEFYPYVRIVMVNNRGKFIKKKKTCFRHADANPVFNHSLIFDLSISNLEQTAFLVLLCTKTLGQVSNSDDSLNDEDIENYLKKSRDKVLGSVVLGRNVRYTKARDHWVTVMQNPRKIISVWHDLK